MHVKCHTLIPTSLYIQQQVSCSLQLLLITQRCCAALLLKISRCSEGTAQRVHERGDSLTSDNPRELIAEPGIIVSHRHQHVLARQGAATDALRVSCPVLRQQCLQSLHFTHTKVLQSASKKLYNCAQN